MAVIKRKDNSPPKPKKQFGLHDKLVLCADKWLKKKGCAVRFTDKMKALTHSGEQPDNIGWRDGLSILIECKTSRADFLSDSKKPFRNEYSGVGDWRFYLCPDGVITEQDLPPGWGLLWIKDGKIVEVFGVPKNTQWWNKKPFEGNKREETIIMASALRRIDKAGYLNLIYD